LRTAVALSSAPNGMKSSENADPQSSLGRRHVVFVYGTLKRGHERHFALADQQFIADARTLPRYRMVNLGTYPGLVEGGSTAVAGELWAVDAACLARLDDIEGVAEALYRRALVHLAPPHTNIAAEAYFYNADVSALPDHGDVW
jgi:gamma-glutamylaminecyclotransferase